MVEVSVLIGVLGLIISVLSFFVGRITAAKNKGIEDGEMKADIKYIKTSIDKQESKLDNMVENYDEAMLEIEKLKGRLSALEQKVKILHGEQVH